MSSSVRYGLVFSLVASVTPGCGGCGSKPASDVDKCLSYLPNSLPYTFASADLAALRGRVDKDPTWTALRATAMYKDLAGSVAVLAPERLAGRVASLAGESAADAFIDGLLEGELCGAFDVIDTPPSEAEPDGGSALDYLLAKRLDLSQRAVQRAAEIWLAAGAPRAPAGSGTPKPGVAKDAAAPTPAAATDAPKIVTLPGGDLAYVVADSYLFVGTPERVQALAQRWLPASERAAQPPSENAPRKRPAAPALRAADLALRVDTGAIVDRGNQYDRPLYFEPWEYLTLTLQPASDKQLFALDLAPREGWYTGPAKGFAAASFAPKDARAFIATGQWKLSALMDSLTERASSSEAIASALGVDPAKELVPLLGGEVFYLMQRVTSSPERSEPELFFNHVVGVALKEGAKPSEVEAVMRRLMTALFAGNFERSVLDELNKAVLGCSQRGGRDNIEGGSRQRCFALVDNMLLLGDETAVRASLQAHAGKAPDVTDRGLPVAMKGAAGGALGLIDFAALGDDLVAYANRHPGARLHKGDLDNTLAPFVKALGAFKGVELHLAEGDAGGLRGGVSGL